MLLQYTVKIWMLIRMLYNNNLGYCSGCHGNLGQYNGFHGFLDQILIGVLTLCWIHLHQVVVLYQSYHGNHCNTLGYYLKQVNEHPNFNSVIVMHASRFHI